MKNLRWADTKPSMHFRETNTDPSMHFRKANTYPSMKGLVTPRDYEFFLSENNVKEEIFKLFFWPIFFLF